jgi:ABC-type branched-subunit amino acid transport system ATPase component
MTIPDGEQLGLRVDGLTVRFGGNTAVDGASFHAPMGQVTGLIGPNGAGKTTTFNACSGLLRPTSGTVSLFGQDITRSTTAVRARRGLGRTFQRMELFDSLSVESNVSLGLEARLAGGNPLKHLVSGRAEATRVEESTDQVLDLCGLQQLRSEPAGALSTGQRRIIDLARVLAGGFSFLLLDEPSSGLDSAESQQFGQIVRRVVEERGCGVLLVEHDMDLVMSICAYVYVLDFGEMVFHGTPAQVRTSDVVRTAYLGSEAL